MATRLRMARVTTPEKAEQAHGVQLLRTVGAQVYVLGTRRRKGDYAGTMQTPGIPDIWAFLPARTDGLFPPVGIWWEVKRQGGRVRPEQAEFRRQCLAAHVRHVVGPLDALIAALVEGGWLRREQVPHYRQPQVPTP